MILLNVTFPLSKWFVWIQIIQFAVNLNNTHLKRWASAMQRNVSR